MEYITLKISAQALNTIGAALNELPYKIANPVIKEIDAQVQRHIGEKNGSLIGVGKKDDSIGGKVDSSSGNTSGSREENPSSGALGVDGDRGVGPH